MFPFILREESVMVPQNFPHDGKIYLIDRNSIVIRTEPQSIRYSFFWINKFRKDLTEEVYKESFVVFNILMPKPRHSNQEDISQ